MERAEPFFVGLAPCHGPGSRTYKVRRATSSIFDQGGDDAFGVLVVDLALHQVTGVALDQCRDATVSGLFDQVTFPKAGHTPVFDQLGPPACGYGVLDLAEPIPFRAGMP